MPDDPLSRLRRLVQPVPGLLLHDWGDSGAVVFVPGTGTTHLIDGVIAGLLANSFPAPGAAAAANLDPGDVDSLNADVLNAHLPALLLAGILQLRQA